MSLVMCAFRAATCIIVLTAIQVTHAVEYFVRPAVKGVPRGDGSAYASPWRGFDAIDWQRVSGNTLNVCGIHRDTLVIGGSGVVVDLDCESDKGVILGSEPLSGDSKFWKHRDGEYYYRLRAEACKHKGVRVLARDDAILRKGTQGSLEPGQWAYAKSPSGHGCSVHVKDDPAGARFEYGARRIGIEFPDADVRNFTIRGGEIRYVNGWAIGPGWEFWQRNYGDLVIRGVRLYGNREQGIHAYVPPKLQAVDGYFLFESVLIEANEIYENGGEGMYIRGHNAVRNELVIRNNLIGAADFENFGWDGNKGNYAGDALDVHAGHPAIVEGNTITNVRGIGINLGVGHARVRNNVIRDAYLMDALHPYKAGIVVGPRRYCSGRPDDVIVESNEIHNAKGVGLMVTGDADLDCNIIVRNNVVRVDSPDTVSAMLSFDNGAVGTIHYFANGSKAFPKERLEVFCGGGIVQIDNFRRMKGFDWPGFNRMNLRRQDKGNRACVHAFVDSLTAGTSVLIPFDEIIEVHEATFEIAAAVA